LSSLAHLAEMATGRKLFAPRRKMTYKGGEDARDAIVACFRDCHERGMFPPTYEELKVATGKSSTATIHRHIGVLVKNGVLVKHRKHYVLAEVLDGQG